MPTTCTRCNRRTRNLSRAGNAYYCPECRIEWRQKLVEGGRRAAKKRAAAPEPTMAELDALIARQMRNLPRWWSKCRAFVKGD
jgi:hypothetical protein